MNSWKIWTIRYLLSLVGVAGVAYWISFSVADYVVRANTSSANEAMRALQASIDTLNTSVTAAVIATNGLESQMVELLKSSENHSSELVGINTRLTQVTAAVQDAGINIRIRGEVPDKQSLVSVTELKKAWGVQPNSAIYLELTAPSE